MARPHINPSEQKSDFETPPLIFDGYDAKYGPFDMDAACALGQYSAETILGRGGTIVTTTPTNPGADSFLTSSDPDRRTWVATNPKILYDAFEHPWHGKVWLNPPYGPKKLLTAFLEKAVREVQYRNAELVCALLPSRTGIDWWQEYVVRRVECERAWVDGRGIRHESPTSYWSGEMVANTVEFLPGRIKFVGAKNQAPFASVIVVWRAS